MTFTIHAPQLIYILLTIIGLVVAIQRDGKPRTGSYNLMPDLICSLLTFLLLYWGGFFRGSP